jgi:hypothetical protein
MQIGLKYKKMTFVRLRGGFSAVMTGDEKVCKPFLSGGETTTPSMIYFVNLR